MKKLLFLIPFLAGLQGWGQTDTLEFTTHRKTSDIIFGRLDPALYNGALLDRSQSSDSVLLEQLQGNFNQIGNIFQWMETYYSVSISYIDSNYMYFNNELVTEIENQIATFDDTSTNDNYYTTFGLVLHHLSYLKREIVPEDVFDVEGNQFVVQSSIDEISIYDSGFIKTSSILELNGDHGYKSAELIYNPNFISTSPDIEILNLRIDLGTGFINFGPSNPKINYSCSKDSVVGYININYLFENIEYNDTLRFFVTTNTYKYHDLSKATERWDKTYPFETSYSIDFEVGVRYGCGNGTKVRRPVIIAPPYRPKGQIFSMNKYYDQFDFMSLFSSMSDMGYDVIFLKEKEGNGSVEEAGKAVAEFIAWVNTNKKDNYPDEDWENVVMGFSAGGQHMRYALMYMEAKHMQNSAYPHHHCREYIPFDSPHWGVNIPYFTQAVFHHFSGYSPLAAITYNSIIDEGSKDMNMKHILNNNFDGSNTVFEYNPAPASEKTVLDNALMNDFQHQFSHVSDLRRSFPSFTRNVAISVGSNQNNYDTEYGLTPGQLLFEQHSVLPTIFPPGFALRNRELYASDYGDYSTSFMIKDIKMMLFLIPVIHQRRYVTNNLPEFDLAQGGYKDEFYDNSKLWGVVPIGPVPFLRRSNFFLGQKHYKGHMMFLPMVSALGINPTIWQNNNLYYNLKDEGLMYVTKTDFDNDIRSDLFGYPNLGHPTNHFNITPFEAIYCDPQTYEHIKMTETIEEDEDLPNPPNEIYLVYTRNFILDEVEADVVGLQNKIIGDNHNQNAIGYKYKAWYRAYNRINIGNLVTPKTDPGDYVIKPTGDITVYAGNEINIKPGFHAQNGSNFHAYIDYQCGRPREGKSAQTDNTNGSTENESISQKANTSKLTSNNLELLVYPNPTDKTFSVVFPENKTGTATVFDALGKLIESTIIYSENRIKSYTLEQGIYYIHFEMSNSEVLTEKIIVL